MLDQALTFLVSELNAYLLARTSSDFGAARLGRLVDDSGKQVKTAGPSTPVKVLGFTGLPNAGVEFLVLES